MHNQTCCRVLFNQHVVLTMRSSQMTTAAVLALKLGLLEGFIGSFWDKTYWFDLPFFWVQLLIGDNTALGTLPDMTFYGDLLFLYRMQNGSVGWTWGLRIIDTVSSLWGCSSLQLIWHHPTDLPSLCWNMWQLNFAQWFIELAHRWSGLRMIKAAFSLLLFVYIELSIGDMLMCFNDDRSLKLGLTSFRCSQGCDRCCQEQDLNLGQSLWPDGFIGMESTP